jgi:hypothetical protein
MILQFFSVNNLLLGAQAVEPTETTSSPAPLDFFRNKPPLPDLLLKDKREGKYVTGFPVLGYNPDTKYSYGGIGQLYDNGLKESPFFRYTPYRRLFVVNVHGATGGVRHAVINYDHLYIGDTPWRFRAEAGLEENQFMNYFGFGEETLEPLSFPGVPSTFKHYDEYEDALRVTRSGQTWERFDDYKKTETSGLVMLEYDLFGGLLRPQMGFQIAYIETEDHTGDIISSAVMQETRLLRDFNRGNIIGFGGGWDNAARIGITFDTRDFEPDPSSGVVLQVTSRISTEVLDSNFDYQQLTLSARGFRNLLYEPRRLILAGRLVYAMQFGEVPFYSAPLLPFTDGDKTGLGGFNTIRGFNENRFVGDAATFANLELRWSFAETNFLKQHLRFMLVPFLDTGRVYDSVSRTTLEDYEFGGGLGFRLAWNLATIVSFDSSYSSDDNYSFNMELGHQF